MRKVLFVLITFFISKWLLISCCSSPDTIRYRTLDMEYSLSRIEPIADGRAQLVEFTGSEISYQEFAIRLTPVKSEIARLKINMGNAHACDDPAPEMNASFESIRVRSDVNYDVDHPAGTDLADIIHFGFVRQGETSGSTTLESIGGYKVPFDYYLYLDVPPDTAVPRRFFIEIHQLQRDFQPQIFMLETDEITIF